MRPATPGIRDLARQLVTLEAREDGFAQPQAHAALRACEKWRLYLAKLVGVVGFQTLLARALTLAKAEVSWLQDARVQADGTLEGFSEAALKQDVSEATRGGESLLAQLLGLLVIFLGESLTLRLTQDVWPEAALQNINVHAEETA